MSKYTIVNRICRVNDAGSEQSDMTMQNSDQSSILMQPASCYSGQSGMKSIHVRKNSGLRFQKVFDMEPSECNEESDF